MASKQGDVNNQNNDSEKEKGSENCPTDSNLSDNSNRKFPISVQALSASSLISLIDCAVLPLSKNEFLTIGGFNKKNRQFDPYPKMIVYYRSFVESAHQQKIKFENQIQTYSSFEKLGFKGRISFSAALSFSSKRFYFGGGLADEGPLDDFFSNPLPVYSLDKDLKAEPKMPCAVHSHVLFSSTSQSKISSSIFLYGGFDKENTILNKLYRFDTQKEKWSQVLENVPARAQHTVHEIPETETFVTFGGVSNGKPYSNEVYLIDPENSFFRKVATFGDKPLGRSRHSGSWIQDTLVIVGGWNSHILDDIYQLDWKTKTWRELVYDKFHLWNYFGVDQMLLPIANNRLVVFGGKRKAEPSESYAITVSPPPPTSVPFDTADSPGNLILFGDGKPFAENSPMKIGSPIAIPKQYVTDISACGNQLYALTNTKQVYLFGENRFSSQSLWGPPQFSMVPYPIPIPEKITKISCGALHACAVDETGRVWAWGDEIGGLNIRPLAVMAGKWVTDIASAALSTIFLTRDSFVFEWNIQKNSAIVIVAQPKADSHFIKLFGGGAHYVLINDSHQPFGYGSNSSGQLGYDPKQTSVLSRLRPLPLPFEDQIWSASCGPAHTLLLNLSGEVYSLGSGKNGSLGHGNFDSTFIATKIRHFQKDPKNQFDPVISISALGGLQSCHSVFITASGSCFTAGSNAIGQLGRTTYEKNDPTPNLVTGNFIHLSTVGGYLFTATKVHPKLRNKMSHALFSSDSHFEISGHFGMLGSDVMFYILSFLTPRNLGQLSRANSWFYSVTSSDTLWKMHVQREFPEALSKARPSNMMKEIFISKFTERYPLRKKTAREASRPYFNWFRKKKQVRVFMPGIDAAGKTTILYKLKLGEVVTTIPTIGFNVETIEYKNFEFNIWDVGGGDKIRPLWRHYYFETQVIIWVVDSNDHERMKEDYKNELHRMAKDVELADCVFLIFANKQDLPNAASPKQVVEILELDKLHQPWFIQGCVATTGDGLYEGLDWVCKCFH